MACKLRPTNYGRLAVNACIPRLKYSGEIYAHVNLLPIFAHHENHNYDASEHPATAKAEGDQKAINFFKHITIQTSLLLPPPPPPPPPLLPK
eukprot:scaffold7907_cov163-Skeletonema_marinoi.AAC.8